MGRQECQPTVGGAELRLLNYVSEHEPITVREVSDSLGAELGYVRTTVLQMMERLRKKGLLEREKVSGLYRYRSAKSRASVMKSVIDRFVNNSLGGSVSPLILYLSESKGISDEDAAYLNRLIDQLEESN
jgi:predicted transcriptional regulator